MQLGRKLVSDSREFLVKLVGRVIESSCHFRQSALPNREKLIRTEIRARKLQLRKCCTAHVIYLHVNTTSKDAV